MRTIETTAVVEPDHTITLQLPPEILVGVHRVVLVIDEAAPESPPRTPLQFTGYAAGPLAEAMTFRREDIYDDADR